MEPRQPRIIAKVGPEFENFRVVDTEVIYNGFQKIVKFWIKGINIPGNKALEIRQSPDVVLVIPFDPEKKTCYLVQQPRVATWLSGKIASGSLSLTDCIERLKESFISRSEILIFGFPSGYVEEADTSKKARASQELLEETGFSCKQDDMLECGTHFRSSGRSTATTTFYLAKVSGFREQPTGDGTEDIIVWEIPFELIREFMMDRPHSIATELGICKLESHLREHFL